eukprot:5059150-Lingulodinium_polyedra.AAC.1
MWGFPNQAALATVGVTGLASQHMHWRGVIAASRAPATGAEAVAAPRTFLGDLRSRANKQGLGHATNGGRRIRCR